MNLIPSMWGEGPCYCTFFTLQSPQIYYEGFGVHNIGEELQVPTAYKERWSCRWHSMVGRPRLGRCSDVILKIKQRANLQSWEYSNSDIRAVALLCTHWFCPQDLCRLFHKSRQSIPTVCVRDCYLGSVMKASYQSSNEVSCSRKSISL